MESDHQEQAIFRVMLSSNFEGLPEHRAAVLRVLVKQGLLPITIEEAAVPFDGNSISASLSRLDEADAYIGIIGYRYGPIPQDVHQNPRALSLAELEFHQAVSRRIPVCMFIMHDEHPVPKSAVGAEQGEAEKYRAFAAQAKQATTHIEFKSVDDLAVQCVQVLAKLRLALKESPKILDFRRGDLFGAIANVPVQAPLFNRDFESAAIHNYLTRGDKPVPVVKIYGPPGSGKTTLAASYATRYQGEYRATWFINAHSAVSIGNDLVSLGKKLGWLLGHKEGSALRVVMDRLRSDGDGILLVYDGANDSLRRRYIPRDGKAHVIIATTDRDLSVGPAFFEIAAFNGGTKPVPDYFISYNSSEESIARNVANVLERAGYSVFAQFKDIPIGANFVEEMKRGLAARRVVALLSPAYEASAHCQAEWDAAYADDADGSKRKLVPLLIKPTDLNFLARQVVYANLIGLSGDAFEKRVLEAVQSRTIATEPIKNVVSPIRHEWTAEAKLRVHGSATPLAGLGRGVGDLSKQLSTARKLAERLADQSSSPQFNHSKQYSIQLRAYLEDLPAPENDGNIYLADASARTLREMFAAESDILPVSFAAPLKTFLECHIGTRAYYPELSDFYASVRDGVLVAPLSLDAVERVRLVINEHTPATFDQSVGKELAREEASAPPVADERAVSAPSSSQPQPPPDPIGGVDRTQSRDQLVARSLNGLWSTFLKGKDIVPNIDGWRRTYEALEPTIRPILDYLRHSLG